MGRIRKTRKNRLETKVSKAFLWVPSGGAAPPSGAGRSGLGSHPFRCRWGVDNYTLSFYPLHAGASDLRGGGPWSVRSLRRGT